MAFDSSARFGAYRSLLGNRPFRLWFTSTLGSSLGDWLGLFALQVLVISLAAPGSRIALFGLGGIMMARLLPSILFGPAAGVVADRFDRKRLMVTADLTRAGLFAVIAFTRDLWLLLALVFAVECLTITYIAAKNAMLPHIVERRELTEANQLTLLVTYGPLPFGAAVAAAMSWVVGLLAALGLAELDPTFVALVLNAITFLFAGWLIARMPLGQRARGDGTTGGAGEPQGTGPLRQLVEGFRFISNRRLIRSLVVGVAGTFFGAGVVVALGPELVRSDLGMAEDDWYGLMTTVGMGLLVGMAVSPVLARRVGKERLFAAALVPSAILIVAIGVVPGFSVALAVGFLLGATAGSSFVIGFTLLHERTPDPVRARTFASVYTAARVSMFAALAVGPFLAGLIGTGEIEVADLGVGYSGSRITVVLGGLLALVGAAPAAFGMVRAENRRRELSDNGTG